MSVDFKTRDTPGALCSAALALHSDDDIRVPGANRPTKIM
jgi:hypothetical protein